MGSVFKGYFINKIARTRKDEEAFLTVYTDKVRLISLATLLGGDLRVSDSGDELFIRFQDRYSIISFKFNSENISTEAVEKDLNELEFTRQFMHSVAMRKFISRYKEGLEENSGFFVFYRTMAILAAESRIGEQENALINAQFNRSITAIKNARAHASNFDMDMVLKATENYTSELSYAISQGELRQLKKATSRKTALKSVVNSIKSYLSLTPAEMEYYRQLLVNVKDSDAAPLEDDIWNYIIRKESYKSIDMW